MEFAVKVVAVNSHMIVQLSLTMFAVIIFRDLVHMETDAGSAMHMQQIICNSL